MSNSASLIVVGNTQGCQGNTIGGNLQGNSNSDGLSIDDNKVSGNLQTNSNPRVAIDISGNTVGGNLQCQSNVPPPPTSRRIRCRARPRANAPDLPNRHPSP